MKGQVRTPIQKRSIQKKEQIIKAGFDLICEKGYYNTNTAEIAKKAGVSTGIVYNYFNDKHDILIEGIKLYAENVFYPMIKVPTKPVTFQNLKSLLKNWIDNFIDNHKLTKSAHEELMAMTHTDSEIANIYHIYEIEVTDKITDILSQSDFNSNNLKEKVHISLGLIENLCHEIVYHKHQNMDYNKMTNLVINTIINLLKKENE